MGMESYYLAFIHKNSRIVQEKEMWKLSGTSNLPVSQIQTLLAETCRQITENEWLFDECIDILLHHEDGWFQGMELRGCLAYFNKGIEQCYTCYQRWSRTIPLQIFVLNQPVQVTNCEELRDWVSEAYGKKIKWFQQQYGDIEWKVRSSSFYREVKKRQGLWYRLSKHFHREQ